jgi:hypothetical protein
MGLDSFSFMSQIVGMQVKRYHPIGSAGNCPYIKYLGGIGYTLGTNYNKEANMSYARINMVEFNSVEDAVVSAGDYAENAAAEFPEAEILLSVATGNESAVVISIYPDKDAFERSAAARATRMGNNQNRIKDVEVLEGEVTLCHVK